MARCPNDCRERKNSKMGKKREHTFFIPRDLKRLQIYQPEDTLPMAGEKNWGMATFKVDKLRKITRGEGEIIGVVDTGISGSHPMLQNFIAAADSTGSRYGSDDRDGHGTHVSGTTAGNNPEMGVADKAKGVHGKGLGDGGSGTGTQIRNAMDFCAKRGAGVISMSLGSSGQDPTITGFIKELAEQGIWVVCAGGNSGGNTADTDWPGRSPYAINVAALDSGLNVASFSSAGAKIDTSGPGVNIMSSAPGGRFQTMSGTSMATPFVAGVLCLFRAALKLKGLPIPKWDALRELLFNKSTDAHTPGDDRRTGPGWINPILLTLGLDVPPPITAVEE